MRTMNIKNSDHPALTIAGFARAGGVGVETIRYYQRRGLLEIPERIRAGGGGGIRRYGAEDIRRLRFIRSAQTAGFTLEQIGDLLLLDAHRDRKKIRALAEERITALNNQIAALESSRDALTQLAQDCGAGGRGPCPIVAAFDNLPT